MQPLITVIVPVHNDEKYIRKCIESIQASTYQNIEIICVDDQSSDASVAILNELSASDERIIIVQQEWGGVSKARNTGLERSSGSYIGFIDADDWIHPYYFQWLMQAIDGCDLSICEYEFVADGGVEKTNESGIRDIKIWPMKKAIKDRNTMTFVHGRLYRKDVINGFRFSEKVQQSEDLLFNHYVIPACHRVAYIPIPLYYRRVHNNSLIHTANAKIGMMTLLEITRMAEKEPEDSNIMIRRAYRDLISYRHKFRLNNDNPDDFETEIKEVSNKLLAMSHRLPSMERWFYCCMVQYPSLFEVPFTIRKFLKRRIHWFKYKVMTIRHS